MYELADLRRALLAGIVSSSALSVWYFAGALYTEVPYSLLAVLFVLCAAHAAALAQEAVQRQKNGHKAVLWVREDHLKDPAVASILKQAFGEDGVISNRREQVNVEKLQHEA